ncbi:hypothetical protein EX895_001179 [Sporisorium graminicola]|uniref:Uncharacterized protein n=1 Tax=Sporisorium graminicola TaxID=280036 RepID=A0A4U7L3D4_9BASI|nr:hypothetical protein EX895_001179 [Sporisorium graminicola]TKY89882.1 hypothetical protein EX895_001179 [Sporisorium graminicola]
MPTSTMASASATAGSASDPLAGVDHIIVIDNGAQNIRIASIPYPFTAQAISAATSQSSQSSIISSSLLAQSIAVDVFPNAIARTRTPHTIPSLPATETSPTAPPPGSKTSIFVSSHIHTLLDDYAALHLRLPHQSGIVVDWAAQKTIWDHVLTNHLAKLPQVKSSAKKGKLLEGKAVIITEAYFNLEHSQHATDLLLFEHYGAQAVWRTSSATLAGLGTDVFQDDLPLSSSSGAGEAEDGHAAAEQESNSVEPVEAAEAVEAPSEQGPPADRQTPSSVPSKRPLRTPRASTTSTSAVTASDSSSAPLPRILTIPRPQAMLVLDLGYSYCHAIPIINGIPQYPSIRRLELGGKMLINLLKETLSFQQLDMMDESWLMSHIFARTSFVAASVGQRVYGAHDKVQRELQVVQRKEAAEWTYNDLLLMAKYGGGKRFSVTWNLPDYGGQANGRGGIEKRDRARYGYILDGPDPRAYQQPSQKDTDGQQHKLPDVDAQLDWESSFIASPITTSHQPHRPSSPSSSSDNDEEDLQTLTLTTERFSVIEHLFNPTALGLDQKPLPELVLDAIRSVPSKAAADLLWSNLLLTGGLANAVNLRTRLANELRPLTPADVPLHIWPTSSTRSDHSLIPIHGGVALACELSLAESMRLEREEKRGEKSRKKPRKSRVPESSAEGNAVAEDRVGARWLTYAQWANPAAGGAAAAAGSDADIIRSANAVFYPTAVAKRSSTEA